MRNPTFALWRWLPAPLCRRAAAFGFALVPKLFAFGKGELQLDLAVLEVKPRRDQGQSLLLRFADKLADFFFVHEQLAGAQRGVVGVVAVVIGTDVAVQQPKLAVLDDAVGIFQVRGSAADRFDLSPGQNHSRFKFFEQEVVMTRVPVNSGILLPRSGRLAARIFLPIRLGLVSSLLGHCLIQESTTKAEARWQVSGLIGIRP